MGSRIEAPTRTPRAQMLGKTLMNDPRSPMQGGAQASSPGGPKDNTDPQTLIARALAHGTFVGTYRLAGDGTKEAHRQGIHGTISERH